MQIAVIGPGSDVPKPIVDSAEQVGELLGEAGVDLICGGLDGIMKAACRGSRRRDGRTIGILPGHSRSAGNEFLTTRIASGLGEGRNLVIITSADAVIAVGGSWGTINEVALAMKIGKPCISLHGWTIAPDDNAAYLPRVAPDPPTAVRWAIDAAGAKDA